EKLVTHYFKLSEIEKAYEVFSKAADHHAIKVIIENDISEA
ncbi:alcohol dehydrogenase, partial [Streptococcus pneumoniae]|nr:alcohol dehydrogenase [Streptococcus pneumoniae]